MKVLEAHNATLTNYEVLTFVRDAASTRYANNPDYSGNDKAKLKGLHTIVNELTTHYFDLAASPLCSANNARYNQDSIPTLMRRLQKYELTKTELLMLFNLRPSDANGVENLIEEPETRFSAEDLEDIATAVAEMLGRNKDQQAENGEDGAAAENGADSAEEAAGGAQEGDKSTG